MSTAAIAFRKPPAIGHRFADFKAESYDAKARTVEAVLSVGAAVKRDYGTEALSISAGAVNLDRLSTCGIPLIDSHNVFGIGGVFGRVVRVWFVSGALMGLLAFDDSDAGRMAEGLVTRGTVRGISIGYKVDQWRITDADGDQVDPSQLRWDDQDCTFTAVRWELLEVSLVSVPADSNAFVRSFRSSPPIGAAAASIIVERMIKRQLAAVGYEADQESSDLLRDRSEYTEPLRRRRRYPGQIWRGGA
jgi:hypothetical protein